MNEKNIFLKAINHPEWLFGVILRRSFGKWMDNRSFIKWEYFSGMGKFPNLENPTTYNEKLQWLKLNDIHEDYSLLVDKYEAKKYVAEKVGEEYIIPTLGIYDSFDEINFDQLPDQFVLKTTHDSGGVVVCPNKSKLDKKAARKKLEKSLKNNYFYEHREYPYKNVKPRIIVEQYMVDESSTELKDYKFFCFDGKCKMLFIATDRSIGDVKFDFFDTEFNHLPFIQGHPWATREIKKPQGFGKMIELAEKLGKGYPHVRVDLYDINGRIYFGELTFFHFSGNVPFEPEEWDYKIGEWLKLPNIIKQA
ncbi:MAG: glycosyl transferase [Bacteroidaceae bacterium]|nr:glycosyl transferase [Bacteroidaceae bacterium]